LSKHGRGEKQCQGCAEPAIWSTKKHGEILSIADKYNTTVVSEIHAYKDRCKLGTRILIQLAEPTTSGTLPATVKQLLESVGASQIRSSHSELPGLFTAIIPDNVNLQELLGKLGQLPEVRYAEADQYRSTL
jgi:hypothetical protein